MKQPAPQGYICGTFFNMNTDDAVQLTLTLMLTILVLLALIKSLG